ALQYFIDQDPGPGHPGNGAVITLSPAQALDSIIVIDPPDTLQEGLHYLYIRTRDNQGRWSLTERKPFWYKGQEMITITALEYFFDNDPGPGNANPYPLGSVDSIDLTLPIAAPCLSQGQHLVFWRARGSNGAWSVVGWDTLVMDTGVAPPVIIPAGPLSICTGDTVTLISTEVFGATYQWQKDGVDLPGADTTILHVTEAGSYALKIICSGSFTTSQPVIVATVAQLSWYRDADGDGFGDPLADSLECSTPQGYVANANDCDDSDELIYPGAAERCNGLDDDCDGLADETGSLVFFRDADGDGFGNPDSLVSVCVQPAGYVAEGSDCDDQDPLAFPGQVWYIDYDGDGYGRGDSLISCLRPVRAYTIGELTAPDGDCKDSTAAVNPAAQEVCNCDGLADDADPSVGLWSVWYQDADHDGFGNPLVSDSSCAQPADYVSNALDCDDNDALAFPGQVWHKDTDGDGYGVGLTLVQCDRPVGYVLPDSLLATSGDCNDNDPLVNPEAQRLEFAGLLNFDTALVYPFTGSQYTTFQFLVEYFDASDATPAFQYPQVVLDFEGNGSVIDANDRIVPMSEYDVNDDHTNDGKLYMASINNLPTGMQWHTSVRSVISGCTTLTGPFPYPDVLVQPDLQIYADDIHFSDPNPDPSSQLTITAEVTNVSDFAADSFLVILVNQYSPSTSYDTLVVTDLDPRSSATLSWVITTPVDPAWCPMQVIVDPTGLVIETNEANNSAVRPFVNGDYNVPGGILVSQLQANPSTAYAVYGARVTLSGKAEYVGTAVALADPSVAGATVNLNLSQTGQPYTTTTNSQGYFQLSIPVPLSAGPYDVQGYITDYTLDTTFTIGFTVENPPCNPDLVSQVSVPRNVFLQGESVVASFNVFNYGCDNAGASILRTSYSGNPTLTQNHNIPALSVGGSDQVTRTITLNTPGYFTLCATADANGDVNEGVMEYNNMSCASIRVLPAVPDIRPSSGPASSAFDCNHQGSFRFSLENVGGLAAGPFLTEVRVILNGDTLDTLQVTVPGIAAQGLFYFNLPWNDVVPGTYQFLVLADIPVASGGTIDEGPFEHNNSRVFSQQVLACKPNLVLRDCGVLDTDPDDPFQGTNVTYKARLSNIGNDTAFAGYDVRFMFSDSTYLDTMVTVDLAPYQSTDVMLTGQTAPAPATLGLTVIADPLNAVDEQYESDNTASGELCWDFQLVNLPSNCPGNDNNVKYTLHETADINVGLKVNHLYDASLMKVSFSVIMPGSPDTLLLAVVDVTNVEQTCYCPRVVSLPFTFIFSQIGTYTFIMEADTGDVYAECNELNNVFVKVIEVTDLPDLRTLSQRYRLSGGAIMN
ncbi:MAG TPA: CARDB domain-containing protein, partial [Bacteroidales bacterium]|nr:CARDB domain-containing protein [Bacteroidales bacterium]